MLNKQALLRVKSFVKTLILIEFMENMLKMALGAILFVLLLSGCATIFTKSNYPVTFNSTPSDATLTITKSSGKEIYQGKTPAVVKLKSSDGFFSKAEYAVKISSPGYADYLTTIDSKIEGWYFGNILLGGIIGMLIVDPATGAMWKLDTEEVNAVLKKTGETAATLKIVDIKDIPESYKEHLVRLN